MPRDEEMLQFYHPDESPASDDMIADLRSSTPEDEASRQELMTMVERALRGATPHQREAFLLFTLEGFRLAEIAAITERTAEQVHADIKVAREHLRRSLVAAGERRQKLVADRASSSFTKCIARIAVLAAVAMQPRLFYAAKNGDAAMGANWDR